MWVSFWALCFSIDPYAYFPASTMLFDYHSFILQRVIPPALFFVLRIALAIWVFWVTYKFQDGEGNGNPLQYSCLEDPMDREAWWSTVHGVAESQTPLGAHTHTHTHTHTFQDCLF